MKKKIFALLALVMATMTASAYDITVGSISNGSLTFKVDGAAVTTADAGKTVTISVTADETYYLDAITVNAFTSWGAAEARTRGGIDVVKGIVPSKVDNNTFTFVMPESNVEVNAAFKQGLLIDAEAGGRSLNDIRVSVADVDPAKKTVKITGLLVPAAEAGALLTIHIPGKIGQYTIVELGKDAFADQFVADVYMPDTQKPLTIAVGAIPADANVQTPLGLLDDYALMKALEANFEAGRVMADVSPVNKYWTFSSGVECVLPAGVKAFTVIPYVDKVQIAEIPEEMLTVDGKRVIAANNGVLLANDSGKGGTYTIKANPGRQKSGGKPSDYDNKNYGQNLLEPVINAKNFSADGHYVLVNNEFHAILSNASKVPAGKAVLHRPGAAGARMRISNK